MQQPTRRSNTSAVAGGLSLGAAVLLGSFVLGALWWRRRNSKQVFFDVNGDWSSTLCETCCATRYCLISRLPSSCTLKTQNKKQPAYFEFNLLPPSPLPLVVKGRKMGFFWHGPVLNLSSRNYQKYSISCQHGQFDTKCDVLDMS